MSASIEESELPIHISLFDSVEIAYPRELADCHQTLTQKLPLLVECDKELVPYFFRSLRKRLKKDGLQCLYLDGRPEPESQSNPMSGGIMGQTVEQITNAVRGAVEERILVLPNLDLLTTSTGGLTSEAREVISLLYENPTILWLGFKDPSFPLPRVISSLFPRKISILGMPRSRLQHVVTQQEARKFGKHFHPFQLYKFISGLNIIRLRRLLSAITGEDYPEDPHNAYTQLRTATLAGSLTMPNVNLNKDIGGYKRIKERLQKEIIDLLTHKDQLVDIKEINKIESLIPRGMIFWGPPGTGKTLFAKAMATSLGAAISIVSGPELKSRWVGESEENLRSVFRKARQSAPAIIIFDELDSFAMSRGTYTGSGVEHSMVNQLLTEMDGFRKEELIFVIGTTNYVESLDPALLRPGRFEFHLCIPYPNERDRREIIEIYDKKLNIQLSERALDYAARRTGDIVESTGTPYSGDHIQAMCRQIARKRLRKKLLQNPTEVKDIEEALQAYLERPELTPGEELVVATHESGHAVCALFCEKAPPIERISIRGDLAGALGFVRYADPAHRHVVTQKTLLDSICVLFGGREAEALFLDDLSIGSAKDIEQATEIGRSLVEVFGMGTHELGARQYRENPKGQEPQLSDRTRASIDKSITSILEEQRSKAQKILSENSSLILSLRSLLLERKVLDRDSFDHLLQSDEKNRKQEGARRSKSSSKKSKINKKS